jgi:hypothetical protein
MTSSTEIPNFFVIGAPKCGTTALCQYLADHDKIFISDPKEIFYWNKDFPGQVSHGGCTSLRDYLNRFSSSQSTHTAVGEGSTHYLTSSVAIEEILRFNPKAKFIAMIRNPIEVVYAYHGELVFNFMEDETDFEVAWKNQKQRVAKGLTPLRCPSPHNLEYARFALYYPQLKRLIDLVPAEQRLILVFDDLKNDVKKVYQETLAFLDVEDDGRDSFKVVYAARKHRFEKLMKFIKSPPPAFAKPMKFVNYTWKNLLPSPLRAKIRSLSQKPNPRPKLDHNFKCELSDFFAEDLQKTSELLGRDLSHWLEKSRH